MLRVVLINIALFMLPVAVFAAYFYISERNKNAVEIEWKNMPLSLLLQIGLGLIVVGMLVTAYIGGDDAGGTYLPARMENGKVIPGEVM
ncbi:MAG: DUF6111 family protein [Alphaproteobacteria bacterium]|nr:DUF6111 family protein [Alphaproteobacteria bacterium]